MHIASSDGTRLLELERLVARLVARRLSGTPGIGAEEAESFLAEIDQQRHTDLSLLGLSSLDWMALATEVEELSGTELADEVLLDPEKRSVAGWAACLCSAGAQITEMPG